MSDDPQQEYFADGTTEALITGLARIDRLHVISRTSVVRYKDATKPPPEIGLSALGRSRPSKPG